MELVISKKKNTGMKQERKLWENRLWLDWEKKRNDDKSMAKWEIRYVRENGFKHPIARKQSK